MNWEVIAYGSGDFLRLVFTAVASIFGNANYIGAMKTAFFLGFLVLFIKGAINQDVMAGVKWFVIAMVLNLALLVPKTTVVITDRVLPSASAVVNNVPLGLAATAGFFSYTGDWFSRAFETVFTIPNAVRYTHNGLLFGHKVLEASRTMVIPDERTYLNFTEFFSSCVVVDGVGHNRFSWEDVLEANDLLAFFSANVAQNAARFKYVTTANVQQILPCRSGFTGSLQPDLQAITDGIMNTGIRGFIANNSTATAALAKYKSDLPPAILYLTGMSITPEALVLQSSLSNTMGNAILKMARSVDDATFATQYARQWAENERRTTYQTMGRIAEEKLPLLRALIEAFLYAIFPIITLTALVMPTAVPFTYITTLLWINLWPPLYAILNFFMSYYTKGVLTELSSIYGSGFNAMANTQLTEYVSDMVATSGYLVSSLPIIAWMLVSRSGALVAMAVSRIMQGYDTSVGHAAEQITRGGGQMGGVQWRETNAHGGFGPTGAGVSPDNNIQTSALSPKGDFVTWTADGQPYFKQIQSDAAVGFNLGKEMTEQTSQELRYATTETEQSREAFVESTTYLGEQVAAVANKDAAQTVVGENLSESRDSVRSNFTRTVDHSVDEFARRNSLDLTDQERAGISMAAQARLGLTLSPGLGLHVEGGGSGSLNATSEELMKRSDIQHYTDKFMQSKEFGGAMQTSAKFALDRSQSITDSQGREFVTSIRNALQEQEGHQRDYSRSQSELHEAAERHQRAEQFSEHITVNGIDAIKDHAIHNEGMSLQQFLQLLHDVSDGNYGATQQLLHMDETMRQHGTMPLVGSKVGGLTKDFVPGDSIESLRTDPAQSYEQSDGIVEFDLPAKGFIPEEVRDQIEQDRAHVAGDIRQTHESEAGHHMQQFKERLDVGIHHHGEMMDTLRDVRTGALDVAENITQGPWTVSPEVAREFGGQNWTWEGSPQSTPALAGPPRMEQEVSALDQGAAVTPPLETGFWPSDAPDGDTGIRVDLGMALDPGREDAGSTADVSSGSSPVPGGETVSAGVTAGMEQESSALQQGGIEGLGIEDTTTSSGGLSQAPDFTPGDGPESDVETPPPEHMHAIDRPDPGLPESRVPATGFSSAATLAQGLPGPDIEQDAAALQAAGTAHAPLRDHTADAQSHIPGRPETDFGGPRAPVTGFSKASPSAPGMEQESHVTRDLDDPAAWATLTSPHEAGTGQTQTIASIMGHEKLRLEPYPDNKGMAIGYGHNLTTNGDTFADGTPIPDTITPEQAEQLLREDMAQAEHDARALVSEERWDSLSEVRKGVLIELAYQHGHENTSEFVELFDAVEKEDWPRASGELLDSNTFKDESTSARMATLATRMANDSWEKGLDET